VVSEKSKLANLQRITNDRKRLLMCRRVSNQSGFEFSNKCFDRI